MKIFETHKEINATKRDVFKLLNDDVRLMELFHPIKEIKYFTEQKREIGATFKIGLELGQKVYHFNNVVVQFEDLKCIHVESKIKQGTVYSIVQVTESQNQVHMHVETKMEDQNFATRQLMKMMKPVIKRTLEPNIDRFVKECEN